MADAQGQVEFTTPGTYQWEVPVGVTSICVVCVGGGGEVPHLELEVCKGFFGLHAPLARS